MKDERTEGKQWWGVGATKTLSKQMVWSTISTNTNTNTNTALLFGLRNHKSSSSPFPAASQKIIPVTGLTVSCYCLSWLIFIPFHVLCCSIWISLVLPWSCRLLSAPILMNARPLNSALIRSTLHFPPFSLSIEYNMLSNGWFDLD